jgi:hypothetical protein
MWGWDVSRDLENLNKPTHQRSDHVVGGFKLILDDTDCSLQQRKEIRRQWIC